jgi:hypothetical protein
MASRRAGVQGTLRARLESAREAVSESAQRTLRNHRLVPADDPASKVTGGDSAVRPPPTRRPPPLALDLRRRSKSTMWTNTIEVKKRQQIAQRKTKGFGPHGRLWFCEEVVLEKFPSSRLAAASGNALPDSATAE